jgi:hypothetical protein
VSVGWPAGWAPIGVWTLVAVAVAVAVAVDDDEEEAGGWGAEKREGGCSVQYGETKT